MLAAMAFISLNLGICNLLPIPILDGGHMLMLMSKAPRAATFPSACGRPARRRALASSCSSSTTFLNDLGRLVSFRIGAPGAGLTRSGARISSHCSSIDF